MIIGPHVSPTNDKSLLRLNAKNNGWGCFQTHFGNPRSFSIPIGMYKPYPYYTNDVLWVWHAAYVASMNPSSRLRESTAKYLSNVASFMEKFGIYTTVVHVVREANYEEISQFIDEYSLSIEKFAIELPARPILHKSGIIRNFPWCLDIAHAYAGGWPWEALRESIDNFPPRVCHCNFPGSEFRSNQDVHGWRFTPDVCNKGLRSTALTEKLIEDFDLTVKLLIQKNVPLIVEGSGFPNPDCVDEVNFIRGIHDCS